MALRIATRRSALALAQARAVRDALGDAELMEVTTSGDRGASRGDKSRWVDELERVLLEGEADVAVHSAKDVPGELAGGLAIVAVPPRADPRDALCGVRSLDELRPGSRVGTSSLRRRAQLCAVREDLEVVELHGNVDTRLRRLGGGELDALVLAVAGLERLGRAGEAGAALEPAEFVPAPGQGALALEARAGDAHVGETVARLDDAASSVCLRAERSLCAGLGASCHTPVGAHAITAGDDRLVLTAWAGRPDGSQWVRDRLEGPAAEPERLGHAVAERLLAAGAGEVLGRTAGTA